MNGLPVKLKKVKVKERFFNYFLITDGQSVLMNKRGDNDIWANMYDLPMVETPAYLTDEEFFKLNLADDLFGQQIQIIRIYPVLKHVLTHQKIYARFVHVDIDLSKIKLEQRFCFTLVENLKKMALPKIIYIFLKNFFE